MPDAKLFCQGPGHLKGEDGHDPAQHASFIVTFGCEVCGIAWDESPRCAAKIAWYERLSVAELFECEVCGEWRPWRNFVLEVKPIEQAPAAVDWPTALEAFATYQRSKALSERTIDNREAGIRSLAKATGAHSPADLTSTQVRTWLGRGVSKSTMHTQRGYFVAFFRFLHDEGLRPDDLGEQLPKIRRARGVPRPYSPAQIELLLGGGQRGAYRRTRVMILLAAFQGFRASEVAAIHGHDVDLDENLVRVLGKGGKIAILPLHPIVRELALTMPRDGYWFPARKRNAEGHIHSRSVSDLMRRAKERAGIYGDHLSGHSLRHSFGTELVRAGVDLRTVQELMRHGSLATTQIYTQVDDSQKRDGLGKLARAQ